MLHQAHGLFELPHGPSLAHAVQVKFVLKSGVVEAHEGFCVTGTDGAIAKSSLDQQGQLEQAKKICHRRSLLADALRNLKLG